MLSRFLQPSCRVVFALLLLMGAHAAHALPDVEIEAQLDDALVDDIDGDNQVDRGDTIGYTVIINNNGTAEALNVEINIPLDPNLILDPDSIMVGPIALDDQASVQLGQAVDIDVLANDRDVDGVLVPDTVVVVEDPLEGQTVVNPVTGVITYTSTGNAGADTFRYTVEDDDGLLSREALVSVFVNTCPIAEDDAFEVDEKDTLSGNVLDDNGNGADSDPDGDPLEVVALNGVEADIGVEITLASGALLTLNADGSLQYDPNGVFDSLAVGETDTDSFTYTISDGSCEDTATVTITINGENDCPTAEDDAFEVDEKDTVSGNVLDDNGNGADSDPDTSDTLTVSAVNGVEADLGVEITLASGALLTLNADGSFQYDPNGAYDSLAEGEIDTDTFEYTVSDGICEDTATVTITINGENDCPTAEDDAFEVDEKDTLSGNVLDDNGNGADSDPDTSDTLTVTAVNGVEADLGVEITLNSGALLTLNADGSFQYDPNGAFDFLSDGAWDTDTFTYTISDSLCEDTATVTITINGENDCPTAEDDAFEVDEKDTISGNVLDDNGNGADSDPDSSDILTVTEVNGVDASVGVEITLVSGALLTLNSDGNFQYAPNGAFDSLAEGESDTDTFNYTISDGICDDTATVTITINGENDCPTAADDDFEVDEKDTLSGNVLDDNGNGADSDPDTNDTLTVTAVNGVEIAVGVEITLNSGALLTLNADGSLQYDPNGAFDSLADGETDTDSFTYTVSDGTCDDTATVTITINGENDCPTAEDDEFITDEATPVSGNVMDDNGNGADSDPDTTDTLTVTTVNGVGAFVGNEITLGSGALLTLNANGNFQYDPNGAFDALNDGEFTIDTFTYTISDSLCEDAATVSIRVDGITPPPVAANQTVDAFGNIELVANSGGLVADPNGTPHRASTLNLLTGATGGGGPLSVVPGSGSSVGGGAFEVYADGSFTYSSASGAAATTDSFTYAVSDGNQTSDPATVTINIGTRVYVINNSAGGSGGTGTSVDPYRTIADFNTVNGGGPGLPTAGDRIYLVHSGTDYNTTLSLVSAQVVEGSGVALVVDSITLAAAGNRPTITSNVGNGVILANNNTLRGFNIHNTPNGFKITGGAAGNLTINNLDATGSGGLMQILTSATFGTSVNFGEVSSTSSPASNLFLNNVTGTMSVANAGALASAAGDAVHITGGSLNLVYSGSISKSTSGTLISVFNRTGGDLTFSGNLSSTGDSSGIRVVNNAGGTVTFSGSSKSLTATGATTPILLGGNTGAPIFFSGGGLNVGSASGIAFNVSNGGTVSVTGSGNIISSSAGTALSVADTTISANGLTFQSISSSGGNSGIVLTNTGVLGSLTVTGTNDTSLGGDNSGGQLVGHQVAMYLQQTMAPSFTNMHIGLSSGNGIRGSQVNGFTFRYGSITLTGSGGAADTANIAFNEPGAPDGINLSGAVNITGNTLSNSRYHGVAIRNSNGTISNLTIEGNAFTSDISAANSLGTAIFVETLGTATTVANISTAFIANNTINNFPSGDGIRLRGGNVTDAGLGIPHPSSPAGVYGTNLLDRIVIENNVLNGGANKFGLQGMNIAVEGKGSGFITVANNSVSNSIGTAIALSAFGAANLRADLTGNTIVANNQFGSQGIGAGTSATWNASDSPVLNINVGNGTVGGANNISQVDGNGILLVVRDTNGTMNAAIRNNIVAAPLSGVRPGIRVDSGNANGNATVCLTITDNTSAGSTGAVDGIGLRKQGSVPTTNAFGIQGMAATASPGIETYVNVLNPNGGGTLLISATSGFTNCNTGL